MSGKTWGLAAETSLSDVSLLSSAAERDARGTQPLAIDAAAAISTDRLCNMRHSY